MNSLTASVLIGIGVFIPLFVVLSFLIMRRKACPDCGEPLSPFLSPLKKTWRHWVEGGYICVKCDCDVDMAGKKVPAGTGPRLRSIVTSIVLLLMLGACTGFLLLVLVRR